MITAAIPFDHRETHAAARLLHGAMEAVEVYNLLTCDASLDREDRDGAIDKLCFHLHQVCVAVYELDQEAFTAFGAPKDETHCVVCRRECVREPPIKPSQRASRMKANGKAA